MTSLGWWLDGNHVPNASRFSRIMVVNRISPAIIGILLLDIRETSTIHLFQSQHHRVYCMSWPFTTYKSVNQPVYGGFKCAFSVALGPCPRHLSICTALPVVRATFSWRSETRDEPARSAVTVTEDVRTLWSLFCWQKEMWHHHDTKENAKQNLMIIIYIYICIYLIYLFIYIYIYI